MPARDTRCRAYPVPAVLQCGSVQLYIHVLFCDCIMQCIVRLFHPSPEVARLGQLLCKKKSGFLRRELCHLDICLVLLVASVVPIYNVFKFLS